MSHIEFTAMLQNDESLEELCYLIRSHYPTEVFKYGDDLLPKLVLDSGDRRLLYKLLNREITFDQYVVRVDCDTKGVNYVCKDDLVNKKGIQKRFFDAKQIKKTEKCLKSLHGVRSIE